jgi:Na+-driven multidrug efflux pump
MLLAFSLRSHYLKPAVHKVSAIRGRTFRGSRRFLRLGLPQGIESCSYALLSAYVATFFGHYGSTILAANSLGAQVESLTWIIAAGLSTAAVAFSGQNYGAGSIGRIRGSFNALLGITALYSGIIMCILLFGGRSLASIFTADAALIESTARYFAILAISQPFMALELAMAGLYRGIQRPAVPAAISFLFTLARAPLSLLVFRAGLSHQYIWWIISGSSVVKGVLITALFLPLLRASRETVPREG